MILWAVSSTAAGQTLPDAPSRHKFLDRENKIWMASNALLFAGDAATTRRNLAKGGYEKNPLARVFVTRGPALQTVYWAGSYGALIGGARLLHVTGHHRMERATFRLVAVMEAGWVAHNLVARSSTTPAMEATSSIDDR